MYASFAGSWYRKPSGLGFTSSSVEEAQALRAMRQSVHFDPVIGANPAAFSHGMEPADGGGVCSANRN